MNNNFVVRFFLFMAVVFLLASCGSAPKIGSSQRFAADVQKTSSVQFVYRKSDLRQVSSINRGAVKRQDHGYSRFGGLLASQAAEVFEKYGVKVVVAREIGAHDKIEPPATTADTSTLLIVYAVSGDYSANLNNSRSSYVFEARLMDVAADRIIWRATIETSTWSGDDFLLRNMNKTLYDEAYAGQLLNTLAEKMKSDQVI